MNWDERRVEPGEPAFALLKSLKDEGYNVLVDFTAVDYLTWGPKGGEPGLTPKPQRFEAVWRLMKLDPETGADGGRVAVYAALADDSPVLRSAASLWPIADWLEREVWDMFGVRFVDRPDIKRLLLYEEFRGHPLRKDYPIAKRQPLIGPPSGEPAGNPSFNHLEPTLKFE